MRNPEHRAAWFIRRALDFPAVDEDDLLHDLAGGFKLDCVYNVHDAGDMPTTLHSCRIENEVAPLLARQARRKKLKLAALSALYLGEKAVEEEFPGIGFRDGIGGREAYVQGSRVAVWEVVDVHREAKSAAKTADHFGWPDHLVKCALAFAKAFPHQVAGQREAEVSE